MSKLDNKSINELVGEYEYLVGLRNTIKNIVKENVDTMMLSDEQRLELDLIFGKTQEIDEGLERAKKIRDLSNLLELAKDSVNKLTEKYKDKMEDNKV